MTTNKCRVCGRDFFKEPLLCYENMPSLAQYLPEKGALPGDKGIKLRVCQCSGCGLVQLSNDPVTYYKEVIRAAAVSEEMKAFRRKQFADFAQKYSLKGKKIIELGCGCGEYLSIMRQTGAEVFGLEQAPQSVKTCVASGLKVTKGFMRESNALLKAAPFAAFYILNYLEHLPDPNSTLKGMWANLEEAGVGLVEVPNFDMILKNELFSEFTSDHLLYFTRETLSATLRLNGFEVIECSEVWHDYIISVVVKKRAGLNLSCFSASQARLKSEIEAYLGRFNKQQVAVWGAGHQALALIALMDLSDKIKYVVDSAVFKQGKYTPATHVRIVAPEILNLEPVEAVVIMAASYSEEVARLVRQKHPDLAIAILRNNRLEII